jgi:hypothetical protein
MSTNESILSFLVEDHYEQNNWFTDLPFFEEEARCVFYTYNYDSETVHSTYRISRLYTRLCVLVEIKLLRGLCILAEGKTVLRANAGKLIPYHNNLLEIVWIRIEDDFDNVSISVSLLVDLGSIYFNRISQQLWENEN